MPTLSRYVRVTARALRSAAPFLHFLTVAFTLTTATVLQGLFTQVAQTLFLNSAIAPMKFPTSSMFLTLQESQSAGDMVSPQEAKSVT